MSLFRERLFQDYFTSNKMEEFDNVLRLSDDISRVRKSIASYITLKRI